MRSSWEVWRDVGSDNGGGKLSRGDASARAGGRGKNGEGERRREIVVPVMIVGCVFSFSLSCSLLAVPVAAGLLLASSAVLLACPSFPQDYLFAASNIFLIVHGWCLHHLHFSAQPLPSDFLFKLPTLLRQSIPVRTTHEPHWLL